MSSESSDFLKNRKFPYLVFPFQTIWSQAKNEEKFALRDISFAEELKGMKKARAYINANGVEDLKEQKSVEMVFCLYQACYRVPEKEGEPLVTPRFDHAETLLRASKSELAVLNRCYQQVVRTFSPVHTKPISDLELKQLIAAIHVGEHKDLPENPAAVYLAKFSDEQLVEIIIQLALKSPLTSEATEADAQDQS